MSVDEAIIRMESYFQDLAGLQFFQTVCIALIAVIVFFIDRRK